VSLSSRNSTGREFHTDGPVTEKITFCKQLSHQDAFHYLAQYRTLTGSRPRDGFEDECGGPRKTAASPPERQNNYHTGRPVQAAAAATRDAGHVTATSCLIQRDSLRKST